MCPVLIGWKIPYKIQLVDNRFSQQVLGFTWGLQYSSSQLKTLPDSSAKFDTEILALNDWNRLSMMFWNYTIRWHCKPELSLSKDLKLNVVIKNTLEELNFKKIILTTWNFFSSDTKFCPCMGVFWWVFTICS